MRVSVALSKSGVFVMLISWTRPEGTAGGESAEAPLPNSSAEAEFNPEPRPECDRTGSASAKGRKTHASARIHRDQRHRRHTPSAGPGFRSRHRAEAGSSLATNERPQSLPTRPTTARPPRARAPLATRLPKSSRSVTLRSGANRRPQTTGPDGVIRTSHRMTAGRRTNCRARPTGVHEGGKPRRQISVVASFCARRRSRASTTTACRRSVSSSDRGTRRVVGATHPYEAVPPMAATTGTWLTAATSVPRIRGARRSVRPRAAVRAPVAGDGRFHHAAARAAIGIRPR